MTLVSVAEVQNLICYVTNSAIGRRDFTKSDIQHRLVYEVGIMPQVVATDEQMLELLGEDEIRLDDDTDKEDEN